MEKREQPSRIIIGCGEAAPLRVIAEALRNEGLEVETARSHKELLRKCQHREYALIITRFVAPLIDSPKAVARLRGRERRARLFVLSHTHNDTLVVTLLERGVNQFLSLPIYTPRLTRKVTQELHKFRTICQS
jgi:PleD family two-component response regulator